MWVGAYSTRRPIKPPHGGAGGTARRAAQSPISSSPPGAGRRDGLTMTDCFAPWNGILNNCTNAVDGMSIPGVPSAENAKNRTILCAAPECQNLFTVFRKLVTTQCPGALEQVAKFPDGMFTQSYCPTTPAPTTRPPTTTTPRPTTKAPVATTVTQSPLIAPTPAPTKDPSTASGTSTTTIVGAAGGGLVVVLLVIIVVMCLRRKRKDKLDQPVTPYRNEGFAYADISNARTEESLMTESDLLRGGLELAAMRIPYNMLQFGEVISQGGSGEVTHGLYNGKRVAVKRLLAARRKDPHSIRSFFKEIQLTSTLDHECIVKFIGVSWDIPANLCMVSEFMVGGDLRSLLSSYAQRGHPNGHDDGKLKMAIQVAHALTYLHTLSTPVVHRDLKSRNILLSSEGDAKLIDFGISCERQDVTMTAGVGTSLWMAPEVMLGQRYDEKADVFSFGVILSELDTHELPYDHARDSVSGQKISNMVMMQQISEGKLKPRFTQAADPEMVALAKDCLEVDPTKRPLASQVLYRIHRSRNDDKKMTRQTRAALNRSMLTVETSSRGGASFAMSP